jgi:uncharacterized protein (TIGR02996 family)
MTKRDELLEQIRTTHDDHAYQVYADFVEQEGDQPRAMLIRFQCELAGLAKWRSRHRELQWEVDTLLAEHGARWRRELPVLDGVQWTDFERGFVSAVRVRDAKTLYTHADAIAAAAPVTCAELTSLDETYLTPPESGITWLRRVRVSDVRNLELSRSRSLLALVPEVELCEVNEYAEIDLVPTALRQGREAPLERLVISGEHIAGAQIPAGVESIPLENLRELIIGTEFVDEDTGYFNDPTLRAAGARRLAMSRLDKLEILDVSRQRIGTDGIEALVDSMPALRQVRAPSCEVSSLGFLMRSQGAPIVALDLNDNPIGDDGAAALAVAPRVERLESLDLRRCEVTADGLSALFGAPFWPKLHRLDLGENPFGISAAVALVDAPAPKRLTALYLASIDATREAAEILAELPWLWQLHAVDLSRNAVAAKLVAGLANVRALAIRHAELDAGAAAALAPIFPELRHLAIANNHLGDAGLAAFAADGAIETLDLRACGLGDPSLTHLASLAWPRLHTLALSSNAFTRDGIAALVRSPVVARLVRLDLANCELDDHVVPLLTETPALAGLRALNLGGAKLSERSLLALARSPHLRSVPRIRVSGTRVSAGAARQELDARFGRGWQHYADPDDDLT